MRVSEIYASTQGEGPRVGMPTIFLRFAGCNLSCPAWACDSQHAIDPKLYRKDWKEWGVDQVYEEVMRIHHRTGARNVCFTGGEPFLQNKDHLRSLSRMLYAAHMNLEVFTNGTLEWPDWSYYTFRFIMDWKLKGSGENISSLDIPMNNADKLTIKDAIKFTVASPGDLQEAYNVWNDMFRLVKHDLPEFYVGPVWGKMEPAKIVDWMLMTKVPWRLNIQAHKYIWEPNERAV